MATTWNPSDAAAGIVLSNANLTATLATPRVAGFAINFTSGKYWSFNNNNGQWNQDVIANQNPVTGAGGIAISGTLFPMASLFANTNVCTFNGGASAFAYSVPSGYTAWNTLAGTSVTWDPANKNAAITLSGSNLTATGSGAANVSVKATDSLSTGLAYFEMTMNCTGGVADAGVLGGIGNASASLNSFPGSDNNSWGLQIAGGRWHGGSESSAPFIPIGTSWNSVRSTTSRSSGKLYVECVSTLINGRFDLGLVNSTFNISATVPGFDINSIGYQGVAGNITGNSSNLANVSGLGNTAISGLAIDIGAKLFWLLANLNHLWNGLAAGSSNPATGVGGLSFSYGTGPFFLLFGSNVGGSDNVCVLNTGASAFQATPPSGQTIPPVGFTAWDPVGSAASNFFFAS